MGRVKIADNSIWLKHIERDEPLRERLRSLRPGEVVDLEVGGILGRWARMNDGKDGRPTEGIRPIESMKAVWNAMQKDRGKTVVVKQATSADTYLEALGKTFNEWDSPEDEEAYRDL